VIDAALFVPQSRPRQFMIGIQCDVGIPAALTQSVASLPWHPRALRTALANAPAKVRENWIWWSLREPARRNTTFADLVEDNPFDVKWCTPTETHRWLGMMSEVNRAKLDAAKGARRRLVGTVYRRTRLDEAGRRFSVRKFASTTWPAVCKRRRVAPAGRPSRS
jgi:DNA (cytosine-5)-methyltransferase 1